MYIWISILLIWLLLGISIILYKPEECTKSTAVALFLFGTLAYCYTNFLQHALPIGTRIHMFVVTVIYIWIITLFVLMIYRDRLQSNKLKVDNEDNVDTWWNSLTEEEKQSIKDTTLLRSKGEKSTMPE